MNILSKEDLQFFDDNGYVVVPNAVPQENLDTLIGTIFEFLGMNPDNPSDWYRDPLTPGGMIEMYQHQSLWNNRQDERLHGAFADLFDSEKLWVSFDRANLKPPFDPAHPEYDHKGFMHWDLDITSLPRPRLAVQGVLYLTDTDADMGGFRCAPGHHKIVDEWAKTKTADTPKPDVSQIEVVPIVGKAGDLVIWNSKLLHGNGRNLSHKPRLAQYISMFLAPTGADFDAQREGRITQWRDRLSPNAHWAPGDPRKWEQSHGTTAELTPLGRKLLGLDTW